MNELKHNGGFSDSHSGARGTLIDTLADWLVNESLGQNTIEHTFGGTCERLRAFGLPLDRATLSYVTLHPQIARTSVTWSPQTGISRSDFSHEVAGASSAWLASPLYHLMTNEVDLIRRRMVGPEAMLDFPILVDLEVEGYTDYLACKEGFITPASTGVDEQAGMLVTWATKREYGFTDADMATLLRIQRRLAVACKVSIQDQITNNVLETYLGRDASRQVLAGNIRRGDGSSTHAVIFYSDLRDSTGLADRLPPDEYLSLLNCYFDCAAGAVTANGGDILTFIGDAVLAIFPIEAAGLTEDGHCQARCAALDTALEAHQRHKEKCKDRIEAGLPIFNFGVALHVGDVVFGNIGIPERLAFTVIGPTMNEVARLETMTKNLDKPVLMTGPFADKLGRPIIDMGSHALSGVREPCEVYAPDVKDLIKID